MIAFHNDEKIKQKFLARLAEHRRLDNLVKGATGQDGKGCAVWCTMNAYDHKAYETEIGVPQWLARMEDAIFEGLPKKEAMEWPERFLKAIKPGVDLEKVKGPFLIFVLESTLDKFNHKKFPDVKKAINTVIGLYRSESTDRAKYTAASDAANAGARAATDAATAYAAVNAAAAYAAYAARAAAYTAAIAANSAAARDAAIAAYAAAIAANNAAAIAPAYTTAWAADANAAAYAAYKNFADKLIELIEGLE
jgi:hypothetical protein